MFLSLLIYLDKLTRCSILIIICRIKLKSPVLDLLMKERYHRIIVDHMYCILIQRKKIQHLSNKNQDNTTSYKIWNFTHSLDWKRLWLSFWKLCRLLLSQQFLMNLAINWIQAIMFKVWEANQGRSQENFRGSGGSGAWWTYERQLL